LGNTKRKKRSVSKLHAAKKGGEKKLSGAGWRERRTALGGKTRYSIPYNGYGETRALKKDFILPDDTVQGGKEGKKNSWMLRKLIKRI